MLNQPQTIVTINQGGVSINGTNTSLKGQANLNPMRKNFQEPNAKLNQMKVTRVPSKSALEIDQQPSQRAASSGKAESFK